MQIVADLHLHSKYSRAVSKEMTLTTMARFAKQKGLDLLTVCDWTHPMWLREVKSLLEEAGEGIYRLKVPEVSKVSQVSNGEEKETLFLFSTEISSIYSQGGRVRRIHNLVFVPNIETAEKVGKALLARGANLSSDGRPIIGISSRNLLELILEVDERCMLIPCHAWTPHFGIYGLASGFDSLQEAFGDLAKYVYGIETGLSSDPEMNWQMQELQNRSILSFSDAHSPAKMGREATVFELEESSYENIRKAIMRLSVLGSQLSDSGWSVVGLSGKQETDKLNSENRKQKTDNRIAYTIEFYPEEGKYHFSGHRNCKIVYGPDDIRQKGNTCPVCKRRLTEGVLYRVQHLGNEALNTVEVKMSQNGIKWYVDKNKKQPPFVKLVPLLEIVAESMKSTVISQKVKTVFFDLCEQFGSEIEVLLKTPIEVIQQSVPGLIGQRLAEGIEKVRKGHIAIDPGFDGEYGKVRIWNDEVKEIKEAEEKKEQMELF